MNQEARNGKVAKSKSEAGTASITHSTGAMFVSSVTVVISLYVTTATDTAPGGCSSGGREPASGLVSGSGFPPLPLWGRTACDRSVRRTWRSQRACFGDDVVHGP